MIEDKSANKKFLIWPGVGGFHVQDVCLFVDTALDIITVELSSGRSGKRVEETPYVNNYVGKTSCDDQQATKKARGEITRINTITY